MSLSKATRTGLSIVARCIDEKETIQDKIEALQSLSADLSATATDAAQAAGYTPNATSTVDKQTNTEVVAWYREIYGHGFTCYGSHGRGKVDLPSCSPFQIKVVNWFASVPRLVGKAFQVARATK